MLGSKYLLSLIGTAWPAVAGLQKSINGSLWGTVWTEAIPTLAATWQSFAHAAQTLSGTYQNIRVALLGTIAAQANNDAAIQCDTVTLTLDSAKTPSVSLNTENNIYYLALTLTNTTTGDYAIITFTMSLNRTLTIDTNAKTVTYDDGTNAIAGLVLSSVRNDWLPLQPGANLLQVDDVGMANTTIVTTYTRRNM